MMTTQSTQTPTREEAITRLVDLDVAKWGEEEREAAQRSRSKLSHGLALNALAHHDPMAPDRALAALARRVMTAADRATLRRAR